MVGTEKGVRVLRVLWNGDSPTISTGFSRCTVAACDALHAAGHEVHILGINETGDHRTYHSPIYPCIQPFDQGRDAFGVGRMPVLVDRLRPDVICCLNDPWNLPAYTKTLDAFFKDEPSAIPPICAWLAVDGKNQHGWLLNRLSHIMVWTKFAEDELRSGGYKGTCSIVPLGVDHSVFYPRDRAEARRIAFQTLPEPLPDDAFIVGVVGRLQHRKRIDLSLRAFAEWIERTGIDNSFIYIHAAPTGDTGCHIRSLTRYYGLDGRVVISEPHIGRGVEETVLPWIYASFDTMLTTTQGEGWGLCQHECMAMGVPVVVPDWSALGVDGWTGNGVLRVPCNSTALTAPMNGLAYTIGGVADCSAVADALDLLYRDRSAREHYAAAGLAKAAEFSWQRTGAMVVSELERVVYEAETKRRQQSAIAVDSGDSPATEPAHTPVTSQ